VNHAFGVVSKHPVPRSRFAFQTTMLPGKFYFYEMTPFSAREAIAGGTFADFRAEFVGGYRRHG